MICYFTNWATDRNGDGKYVPENLQNSAKYCTHIYYAYAKLDPITLELRSSHIFTDETNGNTFKRGNTIISEQLNKKQYNVYAYLLRY